VGVCEVCVKWALCDGGVIVCAVMLCACGYGVCGFVDGGACDESGSAFARACAFVGRG